MRSILLLAAPLLSVTLLCGCPTEAPPSEPASAAPAPPPVAAGSPAHQRAVEVIAASPFAEQGAVLAGALAPHVTLLPSRVVMDELPMGASRLAGSPDVLPGFAWPMYGEEPMALLAQLNLAELAEHAPAGVLPEQGWLTLFRAVESGGQAGDDFALRYHAGTAEELVRFPDGALGVATVMSATGSFDHRAIDGADGAALMQAFQQLVENPMGLVV